MKNKHLFCHGSFESLCKALRNCGEYIGVDHDQITYNSCGRDWCFAETPALESALRRRPLRDRRARRCWPLPAFAERHIKKTPINHFSTII
ncbi:Hypothetical predicted protein [Marmota monax]|uniref:Uncharacterized protein n=1 Tax=Marmota monax TaxID=9995 RepID=A0A5E4B4Q0_MARMO|nr:hypothetical protein GHT09_002274 [Marmota monax]VTJ64325.1 Hypothetical predicted protein [Marmota monax]